MKRRIVTANIPSSIYKKIHTLMPIACVDIIIKYKNKFLMIKRNNEPVKGYWWFLGGRIFKGETLNAAVKRKVKEEAGLNIKNIKFLGADETIFKTGPFGWPTHTINMVFLCETKNNKIKIDEQSEKYEWFSKINKNWPSYIKKFLMLAGIN